MIHDVALYVDQEGESPAQEFLKATPAKVNSLMWSIAFAVAEAPPKRFSGGGYWESMRGSMVGWCEIRVDGPRKKLHYRPLLRFGLLGVRRSFAALGYRDWFGQGG